MQVVWLGAKGFGVKAAQSIRQRDPVCEYEGRLMSAAEAEARASELPQGTSYMMFFESGGAKYW